MIDKFFDGMGTEGKIVCFAIAVIAICMILAGVKDFLVTLFRGRPPIKHTLVQNCEHSDNLTKLCLRGSPGCATREDCRSAVEDNDY